MARIGDLRGRLLAFSVLLTTHCSNPPAEIPEWVAEPLVRAGELDGPGALGAVFHVEVGRQGEILVAESRPPRISVFDASGRFLRTVGRAGQGPGEFQALGRIGWAADTLWALDAAGRLNLYDAELNFVRMIRPSLPEAGGSIEMYPGPMMADGSVLAVPLAMAPVPPAPVMLVPPTGGEPRTLAYVELPPWPISLEVEQFRLSLSDPWADHPLWLTAADGTGLIILERRVATQASDAHLRMLRIGLNGDTLVDRPVPYAPVALDDAGRERTYRSIAERISRSRNLPLATVEDALRRTLSPPVFYPPVTEMVPGSDGTIWLRREANRTELADWDVFDSEGNAAGRVTLPERFRLFTAKRDRAWGVLLDELDVPYVQVYEIRPK